MLSQSTSAAVDVLGALGVSLTQLGDMVSMAPFSSVLKAFGALCTACRNAEENKENVARVQKRAALLLPALALIHQRLKVISDADLRANVEELVGKIIAQLDAQVRWRVLQAWVGATWPSMVPPPPRQHSLDSGRTEWIGWAVQRWPIPPTRDGCLSVGCVGGDCARVSRHCSHGSEAGRVDGVGCCALSVVCGRQSSSIATTVAGHSRVPSAAVTFKPT